VQGINDHCSITALSSLLAPQTMIMPDSV